MLSLKGLRSVEKGFSDLLPWAAVVDDGIILNKDGSLMAGYYYSPGDITSSIEELESTRSKINNCLSKLGSGWMTHHNSMRIPSVEYTNSTSSHFPDKITFLIDEERREAFEREGTHFETIFSVVFTYTPPQIIEKKFLEALIKKDPENDSKRSLDKLIDDFKTKMVEIEDSLHFLHLDPMIGIRDQDPYGRIFIKDSFLQFLNFCLCGELHPVILPTSGMYIDSILGSYDFIGGLAPKIDTKYIGMITLSGFPSSSLPAMLSSLNLLPEVYRMCNRFIYMDKMEALNHVKRYRRYWQQKVRGIKDQIFRTSSGVINQDAEDMTQDTEVAISEISSGLVNYGYYTSTITVINEDADELHDSLRKISNAIKEEGFNCRIESINSIEAYLGSLPGHILPNLRKPIISTLNLADLIPTSSIWPGLETNPSDLFPPDSPPLSYTASEGATPYRLNLHVSDVGHTLIFGPTGSGKSTLLSLIVAQFLRYEDATVFVFDKGRSLMPLTLAANGHHYDILSDNSELEFSPLNINSDVEQAWAEEWIASLIELQGVHLTPKHVNKIHTAMSSLRESSTKVFTDFVTGLQDKQLEEALDPFFNDGAFGELLDGKSDTLKFGNFQTFEIETLMGMGEKKLLPVLLYLFHRISSALKGQPACIVLDEAWIMLSHSVFRDKIKEWLKTMRKNNCAVIMATQSISDAMNSGIIDVLVESCPTKIYLPNPNALEEKSKKNYEMLGLNDIEINILSQALQKRHYYYKSPLGRRLFDLSLGPIALSFMGVSSKPDLMSVIEHYQTYGKDWPFHWLKKRGVNYDKYKIPESF